MLRLSFAKDINFISLSYCIVCKLCKFKKEAALQQPHTTTTANLTTPLGSKKGTSSAKTALIKFEFTFQ